MSLGLLLVLLVFTKEFAVQHFTLCYRPGLCHLGGVDSNRFFLAITPKIRYNIIKDMYMHYITAKSATQKETLIAVAGDERIAKSIQAAFNLSGDRISIKSLIALRSDNVVVPISLNWIVESDERFQKRVVEDRYKNLVGPHAMSPQPCLPKQNT